MHHHRQVNPHGAFFDAQIDHMLKVTKVTVPALPSTAVAAVRPENHATKPGVIRPRLQEA